MAALHSSSVVATHCRGSRNQHKVQIWGTAGLWRSVARLSTSQIDCFSPRIVNGYIPMHTGRPEFPCERKVGMFSDRWVRVCF